jgi:pimeloyl-ACP methyl ester carboxylesterase
VYKSPRGQLAVRQWCSGALERAGFPLASATVDTSAGRVALVSAGGGSPRVMVVPGTAFNAAAALPWLEALSARWAATVVDLPGQPGLSDPRRPWRARLAWYGRLLDEVLAAAGLGDVVLAGNSLGAAVALAAGSPRIAARALISPAGIIRLSVDPALALASARWLLRPTPGHSPTTASPPTPASPALTCSKGSACPAHATDTSQSGSDLVRFRRRRLAAVAREGAAVTDATDAST